MSGQAYDLAVIGAGSAGFSAAIEGAEQGARVALIGHGPIGGTCVNVGCVPSKTLIRAAGAAYAPILSLRFDGIRLQGGVEDWRKTVRQKDDLVAALQKSKYQDLLAAYSAIDYIAGRARLDADGGVLVGEEPLRAGKVVIATGSSPAAPAIPGIADVPWFDSTAALALERLPKSILVIGGGYVGCELAQMFSRAGVDVTIVCRSRLLPAAEPEIGAALTACFQEEGITVRGGLSYRKIERTPGGISLCVETGADLERIKARTVLGAAGRRANTEGLGLADAGVALTREGAIRVDDRMRTSRPGIYAAGDVTDRDRFVYMAAYGARIAAAHALNGDSARYDSAAMPSVVFTDPQAASVGLTEAAARAAGAAVTTSVLPLEHLPRALVAQDTRGLIKLVAEAGTMRLLGAQILAPEAGDSIQTAALAIRQKLTVSHLADIVFPYLTTVEGLKLAAQGFEKDVAKLSCCAG